MKHPRILLAAVAALITIPLASTTNSSSAEAATACPSGKFPTLTGTAGAGYAAPVVKVSCTTTSLNVTSNGMISYKFVQKTPNKLAAQKWSWSVPLNPVKAAKTTTIDGWMGTTGFTVSGLPIYGPMEGAQPAAQAYGDPVYNGILDTCKGHTGPASEYHYHALTATSACGLGASPLLGYALDGYPIYGPRGCIDAACKTVVTFESGYKLTGNPKTNAFKAYTYKASTAKNVLDACNGRTAPDGSYQYVATASWPYTYACFRGTPTRQSGAARAAMAPMTNTGSGRSAMTGAGSSSMAYMPLGGVPPRR